MTIAKTQKPAIKLHLQFFAEPEDTTNSNEGAQNEPPADGGQTTNQDGPTFQELLEQNPDYRREYRRQRDNEMQKEISRRFKTYEGIDDPELARTLLEQHRNEGENSQNKDTESDKGSSGQGNLSTAELTALRNENRMKEQRIEALQNTVIKTMVGDYAREHQLPVELSKELVQVNALDLDDNGNPTNLRDVFDELAERFPEQFSGVNDQQQPPRHGPGSRQPGNNPAPKDPRAAGAAKAAERNAARKQNQ